MNRVGMLVVGLVIGWLTSSVQASFIVQPVSATASSTYGPDTIPDRARSGAGLSDTSIVETGDPVPTDWPTHGNGGTTTKTQWLSGSSTNPNALMWIRFDLGSTYTLAGIHVWNYNTANDTDKGFKVVDVLGSLDDVHYTIIADDLTLARASGLTTYAGETYSWSPVQARYVRIEGYRGQNWGDSGSVGLAEARMIAVIPEPATSFLLLPGLAIVALRRRS